MPDDEPMLKPCPFCGHKTPTISDNGRGLAFNVNCGNSYCRASGPLERCAIDAKDAWNTRRPSTISEDVEAVADGVKTWLAANTGFGTVEGDYVLASYIGGHWISLDCLKIARAAIAALRKMEG